LVHDGIVTVNILATAVTREHAVKILDRAEQDIREKLGHAVFGVGDETLESAVAMLLKKCNKTIAIAESCTGGLVSDKLTNIPGISEFFLEGVVAYSNKAKIDILNVPEELIEKYGAVSSQVARAMAECVKKRSSANIGVGITGIAGPTGATKEKPVGLVYIAVVVDDIAEVKECRFRGSRIDIKNFSANTALNMVRLKLIDNTLIL
ncbi:MAG TPA: nicotinamide-nucleotide amidohydrolase family protein, partial [Candidatus Wunengus sp. YC60]|uniref:nicotinamide-nucleotide amidohydrolase family protein n=1 Tax=Candidatus Wunengus sp. YC60 TaxID=3367697 RepID=UPI004026C20F